ncbi:hypothetical protein K469DRAFT_684654 [Zopfia rhizophila CBS 207.26]|uniref:Protein kinase domain-containing protein n=1 Tax=Zopfia rhizophila CBS 207.26 TaxID=1314779 RepID=A0A6A6EBU1_9PEZI|nr:hypothetical protein K469DRAFT_684654 [Zopfia rhizophila CBS 207.26]
MDLAVFVKQLCDNMHVGGPPSNHETISEMNSSLRTFFGCLAAALTSLHDNRVRHKSIKSKYMLIARGAVLFTDFGPSRHFPDGQGSTTSGLKAATPRYSPPEVAACE